MASLETSVDMAEVAKDIMLTVYTTNTARFLMRFKIAIALVRLASWVAGFGGVNIDVNNDEGTKTEADGGQEISGQPRQAQAE